MFVFVCVVGSWGFGVADMLGLSDPVIPAEGASIPFQLDIICSHITLSNGNEKQSERFPEEQLAHANMRLLISMLVVMTFLQLPH